MKWIPKEVVIGSYCDSYDEGKNHETKEYARDRIKKLMSVKMHDINCKGLSNSYWMGWKMMDDAVSARNSDHKKEEDGENLINASCAYFDASKMRGKTH